LDDLAAAVKVGSSGAGQLDGSAGTQLLLAEKLHPWVRAAFVRLWHLAQTPDPS
jgi:hypothetical protein